MEKKNYRSSLLFEHQSSREILRKTRIFMKTAVRTLNLAQKAST